MKSIEVEDIADLVSYAMDVYNKLSYSGVEEYPSVDIVADYNVISDILFELMYEYDYNIYSADIDPEEIRESNVFCLSISPDGLWIIPSFEQGEWNTVDTITFVHGDVPSAFVRENKDKEDIMIQWDIKDDEYAVEDEYCDDCCYCYRKLTSTDKALVDFVKAIWKE